MGNELRKIISQSLFALDKYIFNYIQFNDLTKNPQDI